MSEQLNVVVVEDDKDLRKTLVYGLNAQGLSVRGVGTAAELYSLLKVEDIDIVCLDLGLPDEDGIDVASRLPSDIGLIMVTARGMDDERIIGHQSGADLYFVKPVNIVELAMAAVNLGKRVKDHKLANTRAQNPWKHMPEKATLETPGGVAIKLTPNECVLVNALFGKLNSCVSKAEILTSLGYQDEINFYPRLDMLISRLRAKALKMDPHHPIPIKSRHSLGYSFVVDALRSTK